MSHKVEVEKFQKGVLERGLRNLEGLKIKCHNFPIFK